MYAPKKGEHSPFPVSKKLHASGLPSSLGDSPQKMIPKEMAPQDISWADLHAHEVTSDTQLVHDEAMLDEAIEESFPASDPVAERRAMHGSQQYAAGNDAEEESLDHAIEMTFPASDPIAIPSSDERIHEKSLGHSRESHPKALPR